MKSKHPIRMATLLGLVSSTLMALPLGTAFTYQGQLTDGGAPANGSYDLKFILHDAASGGSAVSGPITNSPVGVTNGLFTVTLDFGAGAFTGEARWLEIAVRTNGGVAFTTLSPRQELTPRPYALYATNAGAAGYATTAGSAASAATAPWTGLTGVPTGFADGVDNDTTYSAGAGLTLAGTVFSAQFAGSGAANTVARSDHDHAGVYVPTNHTHNAADLASGTLADARLSANVARLNANQTFTGANTFNNPANLFTGSGAGLTALNASSLTSGTVPSGRLSGTYSSALTFNNDGNSFTGSGAGLTGVNAATLDSLDSASFLRSDASDSFTSGTLSFNAGTTLDVNGTLRMDGTVVKTGTGLVANFNADLLDGSDSSAFAAAGHSHDATYWKLSGNSSTTAGTQFIGTTDNQALWLKVNNTAALRLVPTSYAPNVIGGSPAHSVTAGYYGATIAGRGDVGDATHVAGSDAAVGGGYSNTVSATAGVIAGGGANTIESDGIYSTISGGLGNRITTGSYYSCIAGGWYNLIKNEAFYSTIGGGEENTNAAFATGTIGGGYGNLIGTDSESCTIGGGSHNVVGAGALYATVPGGFHNTAGASYSFAAGRQAKANHAGCFVWADSTAADFASSAANQFLIRASGGVGINTTSPAQKLHVAGRIRIDTWTADGNTAVYKNASGDIGVQASDARLKQNVAPITNALATVRRMTGVTFNWRGDDPAVKKSVGLLAQEVQAALPELTFECQGEDGQTYLGVHYEKVTALLVNALQETAAQIATQQAEIGALKEKLDQMGRLLSGKSGGAQ